MQYFFNIVKADYMQRTRSYSFLITLGVTVFMAYSFVPADTANYTTLSASGYKGVNNSAWVGFVSGIMTTVMLSFYGFLLVNSGIKKDVDTEVGLIIATSPISNFKYLLAKLLSNYLVLLTIAGITFLVSIGVFFMRGKGYPFIPTDFIFPYLFFAVPALFVVAALAVVGEVFLGKRNILQFIIYFFLCGICMGLINKKGDHNLYGVFDPFGLSLMTKSVTQYINMHHHENIQGISFGFIFSGHRTFKYFEWPGLNWSAIFLFSRLFWVGLGIALVYISSLFFHRFDFTETITKRKKKKVTISEIGQATNKSAEFNLSALPMLSFDYGILPFIKTELLLLIRQGKRGMWLLNAAIWVAMCAVPLNIAYGYLLPILLFLQVTRFSELVTKEKTNRIHYFAYASYKPVLRMLPAQILAAMILAITLSLPIIIRCAINSNIYSILSIVNGISLIVLVAVMLGILTGGKKLFEVLFFLLTYSVLNRLPISDYLGSFAHNTNITLVLSIFSINIALIVLSLLARSYQTRHL
ncbi:hypothetical protein [Pedobacter duraquae]|uniref:Uncharacterized protein n=1 Tax=Pedobacter duraquae TaxID=425511 RepID=A0A4V3C344_9SPHI|nr:hypothetical protein [Pedobacter duraquae]TDO20669.1 hypothetical protein CLV32_3302 [Pedobacter duraquae]